MRYSKQRETLLDLLRGTQSHPSADMLYTGMREIYPNISLATIYRNLAQLEKNGDIRRVITDDAKEHFDGFVHHHCHFVCDKCGSISDIELDENAELSKKVSGLLDAEVKRQELTFYGICKQCAKNNAH